MAWDPAPGSHPDWAGERQERGGMDWGYLLVFVVIPMAIAWWLTNRTAQQVNRMWAADHPAEPAVTDKVHSPTDRESDPPAEATIRAHIRTEENRALGLLAQAGHPDTWDVDPQFKTELISHMQQVSPSLFTSSGWHNLPPPTRMAGRHEVPGAVPDGPTLESRVDLGGLGSGGHRSVRRAKTGSAVWWVTSGWEGPGGAHRVR